MRNLNESALGGINLIAVVGWSLSRAQPSSLTKDWLTKTSPAQWDVKQVRKTSFTRLHGIQAIALDDLPSLTISSVLSPAGPVSAHEHSPLLHSHLGMFEM